MCWRNFNYGAFPPTGKPLPVVWKLELFKFMLIHFAECAACLLGCRWGCLHSVDLISLPPLPSFPFSFYSFLLVRQEPRDTYHQDSQKSWTEKSNGKFPGTTLSYLKFLFIGDDILRTVKYISSKSKLHIFLPLKISVNKTTLQLFC